jgi:hypothetical protein
MPLLSLVLYIIVAAVAAFRPVLLFVDFNEHVDASYQAVAHMLVAGLYVRYFSVPSSVGLLYAANFLVVVEVVCAGLKLAGFADV